MALRTRKIFRFKHFSLLNERNAMKVNTDGVLLGVLAPAPTCGATIIDAGAGTGVVALMMAQRAPLAAITAVELDPEGADECRANLEASPWADRMKMVAGDFMELWPALPMCDLLVSNPPFFATDTRSPLQRRADARHEDGFGPVSLLRLAPKLLKPQGCLSMIFPADRWGELELEASLARMQPLERTLIFPMPGKPPIRMVASFINSPSAGTCRCSELVIRNADGSYSDAYRALTSDFYLDF